MLNEPVRDQLHPVTDSNAPAELEARPSPTLSSWLLASGIGILAGLLLGTLVGLLVLLLGGGA